MTGRGQRTVTALAVSVLIGVLQVGPAVPAMAAAPSMPRQIDLSTPQQALDQGAATALSDGINQYAALVDRSTGALVASTGGDTQVISESIVKLFTVAYYLVRYDGHLPAQMATDLHEMIVHSDDRIESQYWTTAAVPAMAVRYRLAHTANGARTGPHDWGWEYITADDEARFLYRASKDPVVGPFLMDAMAQVAPVGADGFDQDFGFNSLRGDHGSKQGWTDLDTSEAINIHSVGWTDRYFGAVLETSASPQYSLMRRDSTGTVDLVAASRPIADIEAAVLAAVRSTGMTVTDQVAAIIRQVLRAITPPTR